MRLAIAAIHMRWKIFHLYLDTAARGGEIIKWI